MDMDGYTIIRDRAKDMIKTKGFPVAPAEVEDLLHKHPDIQNVAIIGVPHEDMGEAVKAFVVLEPTRKGQVTENDIREWARDKMTKYKIPTYVEFRDELPTTLVGKVLRRILKEEEEGLSRL
jgi:long-chain acyl-CoA synthetase